LSLPNHRTRLSIDSAANGRRTAMERCAVTEANTRWMLKNGFHGGLLRAQMPVSLLYEHQPQIPDHCGQQGYQGRSRWLVRSRDRSARSYRARGCRDGPKRKLTATYCAPRFLQLPSFTRGFKILRPLNTGGRTPAFRPRGDSPSHRIDAQEDSEPVALKLEPDRGYFLILGLLVQWE
jgi:hypothetical protein